MADWVLVKKKEDKMLAGTTRQRNWTLVLRLGLAGALLLPLLLAGSAAADPDGVPTVMNYQGELRDADGNPVTGSFDMIFTIYDAETDGTALWTETQTVQVTDGLFSVMLGSVTPLDAGLFDGTDRWLGVAVGGDPEMTPRLRLGSTAYALNAGGLPPGTTISGTSDGVLIVAYTGGEGGGMQSQSIARAPDGTALVGTTTSTAKQAAGVTGYAFADSGETYGVRGLTRSTNVNAAGVSGVAYGGDVFGWEARANGVMGTTNSHGFSGAGVYGYAEYPGPDGSAPGVYGRSDGGEGTGVRGLAASSTGVTYGVSGWSESSEGRGVRGWASSSTGVTYGVHGQSSSSTQGAAGVYGQAFAADASRTYGGYFQSNSGSGVGVYGLASKASGFDTYGVWGETSGKGIGVYGKATAAISGRTYGGYFESASVLGRGVHGEATGTSGRGVSGQATSLSGTTYGGYFESSSNAGIGVHGEVSASSGDTSGVHGVSRSDEGTGVVGLATSATGSTEGVFGQSDSDAGRGVYGVASSLTGGTAGVRGDSHSSNGVGVYGEASSSTGSTLGGLFFSNSDAGTGLRGEASSSTGNTYGGYFTSASTAGTGILGHAGAASGTTYGVLGWSQSSEGRGVYGRATAGSGNTYGVHGQSNSDAGTGVYGEATGAGAGVKAKSDGGNVIEGYGGGGLVFKVDNSGNVYADGQYLSPAADFAEMLPGVEGLEPGDVLAIGPDARVTKASADQPLALIGVYSTAPAFLGGAQSEIENRKSKIPVAIMGVVPVKVTAENGPIRPNDPLTVSSTPGYAAKATPLFVLDGGQGVYAGGTILGRALEGLDSGEGVIQVLLQLR